MKSILLAPAQTLERVYPPSVRRALETEAGLCAQIDPIAGFMEEREVLKEAEVLFSTWGMPALSETVIAQIFPRLKAVFYAAGSVQSFARPFLNKGVRVFSAWGANAVPVAEYTLAQILLANKGFFSASRLYSSGGPAAFTAQATAYPGNYGCAVGLLGAGMIGRLVIDLLKRHNLEILVFDPFLPEEQAAALGVQKTDLETIFSQCQTVSNHLANNPQTAGMLDYALFARMRPGAVFLNTGRGAQVVEEDLCRLLEERPDVTAVLDVTWPEPPEEGHPFYSLSNAVLTPHIAGSTGDEVQRMSLYMLEEFRRYAAGSPCLYEVTEPMLATMA